MAVQCTQAAATCFCASMGTGPRAQSGFDLALTELVGPGGHRFVVQTGSERGAEVLAGLQTGPATGADLQEAEAAVDRAASEQVRSIDTAGIKELLYQNFDHPRWDNVAARCLTLRQLHHGLPHLLLHRGRGRDLRDQRSSRALAPLGFVLHAEFFVHPRGQRSHFRQSSLSPMDDPQAGFVDRPVRHFGMCRLRTLHCVVSRRNRHH